MPSFLWLSLGLYLLVTGLTSICAALSALHDNAKWEKSLQAASFSIQNIRWQQSRSRILTGLGLGTLALLLGAALVSKYFWLIK